MRRMYDSTTAADIPSGSELVAGYVDGAYRWSDQDWARFPGQILVRIAVFAGTNDGHVLDVERGNATAAEAPAWVEMRRRANTDPTVYCSLAAWPDLKAAFDAAHVMRPHWWIADYNNMQYVPADAVAYQYANEPLTGGHYDASMVVDFWPGVDALSHRFIEGKQMNVIRHPSQPRLDYVIAGTDQRVYHRWTFDGNNWQNVEQIGDDKTRAVAASCQWTPDGQTLLVFVVGPDTNVYWCKLPIAPQPGAPKPTFARFLSDRALVTI